MKKTIIKPFIWVMDAMVDGLCPWVRKSTEDRKPILLTAHPAVYEHGYADECRGGQQRGTFVCPHYRARRGRKRRLNRPAVHCGHRGLRQLTTKSLR